ncbi:MAG: hypothetical protein KA956_07390 [Pyrinomonadaceae bacterium]|nr:hypothetical protein [Acidobacteriota bacterium]MBP7376285.1 hypothetical protein [Pyrinomonadaceae bacterium]
MDTYHKMLLKVFEASGGRESVDVDFVEIAKREGYFPSIDDIVSHMKSESWVTESRANIVRITHWGIAEVKKTGSERPDAARNLEREANRMLAATRELGVVIEEFIAAPGSDTLKPIELKVAEVSQIMTAVRSAV